MFGGLRENTEMVTKDIYSWGGGVVGMLNVLN
jgi:hypothetical protein